MVKKEEYSQPYDSDSSSSSSSSSSSTTPLSTASNGPSSPATAATAASNAVLAQVSANSSRYTSSNSNNSSWSGNQSTPSIIPSYPKQPHNPNQFNKSSHASSSNAYYNQSSNPLNTFAPPPSNLSGMQNLTSQLVIAAAAANNPALDVSQVYLQNDLASAYKLPAAAVHLFNQAAAAQQQQHHHQQHHHNNSSLHQMSSASSSSSGSSKDGGGGGGSKEKHHGHGHGHGRSGDGGEVVTVGHETVRKREMRLLKNREAARECRRKKKEYIKCLENRVAVLETQNKTLIDELKSLKALYCQNDAPH